jgi:YrbI family 3-deoxy-D-manno-octulosonate 8-phosphate phosphatase
VANVAFIPVRGGSQSIPLKNIKEINGQPLIYWSLVSLEHASYIDEVIVATDSTAIKNCVLNFKFKKVKIYDRDPANAQNTSSTESVMLEYLSKERRKANDIFVLVQATNPFVIAEDFDNALALFKKNKKANSLLSVVRTKRFFWTLNNKPLNYNPIKRPRRQDYDGLMMENGAFYISNVKDIIKSKNRLTKPIITYEMPEHSGFEIDEVDDWLICEKFLRKYRGKGPGESKAFSDIKLLLSDVDGVLTDAGMYYSENGDELKKFNTYDGMGFQLIQKMGIKVGILTKENRQLNRARAKKLKLDYDFHGIENKLATLDGLLKELGLSYKNVAYVGDDINDIEVLNKVAFAFCPSSAINEVLSIEGIHILKAAGGAGAVREVYSLISK